MTVTKLTVHLPWWWRGLIWVAQVNDALGIPVDPERVVEIIVKRIKIRVSA